MPDNPPPTATAGQTVPFAIDLALLEGCSIVRSQPQWKDVQTARGRLATLRQTQDPYDQMESDRDAVLLYSNILKRSANTIAMGILLGTHLARFSSASSPADRFTGSLKALAEGLDLRTFDEMGTYVELKRCCDEAFSDVGAEFRSAASPVSVDVDPAWLYKLQEEIGKVNAPQRRVESNKARHDAWQKWLRRCAAVMNVSATNPPEILPDINYLRCKTEGSAAGTIMPAASIRNVTLEKWGEAYARAMSTQDSQEIPATFVAAILAALGFDLSNEFWTTMPANEDVEYARTTLTRADTSSRKGLVLVRVQSGSLAANWKPVQATPTLSVTAAGLFAARRLDLAGYLAPRLHGVVVELEPGESVATAFDRVNEKAIRSLFGASVRLAVLSRTRPDVLPPGVLPAISADSVTTLAKAFELVS